MPTNPNTGQRAAQRPSLLAVSLGPPVPERACRNSPDGGTPPVPGVPAVPGSYILVLRLVHPQRIRIGRLGLLGFAGGRYAYVGSACGPGGLRARIGHHLRATPRPHWHIDYLRPAAAVAEVWYAAGDRRLESVFVKICGDHRAHFSPVAGFGASDSRAPAHLFHIRYKLGVHWFARRLRPALPEARLQSWRPSDYA